MRKIFLTFFSVLLVAFVLNLTASSSFAQGNSENARSSAGPDGSQGLSPEDAKIILPPSGDGSQFLGQNHSYSVVFRGNGEAVVSLRAILTNKGDAPLSQITLRVPKVEPKDLTVYQVVREGTCLRYGNRIPLPTAGPLQAPGQNCLEYQEPDYFQYYYGNTKYQKAIFSYSGDTISVTLPTSIEPNKSGSYFIYFRSFGYASKNAFGAYSYNFETLKVNESIANLQIGISTDSDQFLKGAQGNVDYRFAQPELASLDKASLGTPTASSAIDSYYTQIGQGSVIKTASNLSALESYHVKGAFADTRLKLYSKELAIGLAVFLIFLLVVYVVSKKVMRSLTKVSGKEPSSSQPAKQDQKEKSALLSGGIAFIGATIISAYTVGIITLGDLISNMVSYQYQTFVALFLVIISVCIYAVLLFAPGFYIGYKKGIGVGITTIIFTIFFLIAYLAIGLAVVFFIGGGRQIPPYYPLSRAETLM